LHDLMHGFLDTLAELVQKGQRQGSIRSDLDPFRVATMFLGLFQPSAFLYHLSGGTFDMVKQVDFSWKLFSAAIKNEAARTSARPAAARR